MDREKVINQLETDYREAEHRGWILVPVSRKVVKDTLALLKEQEKKHITLHKKHVVTWNRNDTFSMRNLYEAICEELLDEGELFISRTDDHEKVDFVFYVTEGR